MIEVRISSLEILKHDRYSFVPFLLAELRKVGIPIVGTSLFSGVSRGKISWFQDYQSNDIIFRWEE